MKTLKAAAINPERRMTKDQAKTRATAVSATVPGATLVVNAYNIQVRSRSGKTLVAYVGSPKRGWAKTNDGGRA
jgi:hypothetical protein